MVDISEIGITYHLSTENIISGQLDDFANLTKEFFDNLTKVYSQRGRPPTNTEALNKIGEDLAYKGNDLKKSLQTAIEQINVYKDIDKVKEEITKVEKEILQTHSQLKEAEKILAVAVFQAKKKLEAGKQAKSASVSCEDLIKFAFRISSGNSVEAPQDWKPGDPRRPYPLDIEMRSGALGQLSLKNGDAMTVDENNTEDNKTGGLWQGTSSTDDNVHLATMPSSLLSNVNKTSSQQANNEEVEFMSTSSDSSSSGDST